MAAAPYYQDDWVTIYHGDCRESYRATTLGRDVADGGRLEVA